MTENVLVGLRQALPTLRPSEQRIAHAALADPAGVSRMSITDLATHCSTSTATVVRLCKSIGFDGYKTFCLALARAGADESGRRVEFGVAEGDIDPADTTREMVRKLAYQEARAVEETAEMLDLDQLDRVVTAISAARVVDVYGSASSGLAAQDLQQKLRRIGHQVNAWTDAHLALTSAAVLSPDSVAIAFSHSGETEEAISALRTAAERGAFTVGVTNFPESPLARLADATLTTVSRETRFRYGAMSSRMAQLMIVDMIFLGVAQRDPEDVSASLAATLAAVADRRVK
ncbi:MurR/RpiR family transcriptional regulator [Mumia sp. DW29H23]|uniref:MurR/RpiR family transcriptional regulator n=1 Tax=Mumia sp. DW29H23 TaxID=3421241 RepID=UPI003D6817F0